MINVYTFEFNTYRKLVLDFLMGRGDLIVGNRELYLNIGETDAIPPKKVITLDERLTSAESDDDLDDLRHMIDVFTNEAVFYAVYCMYSTVPEEYCNLFYVMGKSLMHDSYEVDTARWVRLTTAMRRSKVIDRTITFDDVTRFYHEMNVNIMRELATVLPQDEWRTVSVEVKGNTLRITTGELLQNILFKEQFGEGRWNGPLRSPTEEL